MQEQGPAEGYYISGADFLWSDHPRIAPNVTMPKK
jgi:hypothetical protein